MRRRDLLAHAAGAALTGAVAGCAGGPQLDESGLIHGPRSGGMKVAHAEYEFIEVDGGTLYRNFLRMGAPSTWFFSEEKSRAWLRHNVEEVGLLEHFLPKLYRDHGGA